MIEYKTYIQEVEQNIRDIERQVSKLEQMRDDSTGPAAPDFTAHLRALTAQRDTMRERLSKLRLEDAEAWTRHDVLEGALGVLDEIGRRLDRMVGGRPH